MQRINEFIKKATKPTMIILVIILSIGLFWILWQTYQANNFGFDKKTFWDWMELLLVPVGLAIAGYWFANIQKKTELEIAEKERKADREIALERQRQQTLENYLDRMKELILDRGLGPEADPEVKRLARTWTLNVLRELSAKRNRQVLQFLQESELLGDRAGVSLRNSDIIKADLDGANLMGANLSMTNLQGANLRGAHLRRVNLSGVNLRGANLKQTDLRRVILNGADLSGANLQKAHLNGANLKRANLSGANLNEAQVKGAVYNRFTHWPDNFDPIAAGARFQEKDDEEQSR